jgi:hypothetical protein
VPGKASEPGLFQPGLAGLADSFAATFVLVVGGDVADPGVQPDGVVVLADDGQLGTQGGGVADGEQVRLFDLEVPVQRLDPGLVGRGAGPAEVLSDGAQREELPRRSGGHLRPVVGDSQQDRAGVVVVGEIDPAVGVASLDGVEEPLGVQGGGEGELDLGGGLLDGLLRRGSTPPPLACLEQGRCLVSLKAELRSSTGGVSVGSLDEGR